MSTPRPRTCTEISAGRADPQQDREPRYLEAFRDVPAYVLLGDPGAGKTTAFEAECEALGEQACRITADEFLTYKESDLPSEWREKTLFIDGLDEVRGSAQGASEFREIRKLLRTLGKPRFRLSCRQADWLGVHDQERLESVAPDSRVTVLRLNPLTDSDVEAILGARTDVPDPRAFVATAQAKGVDGLLFNPLTLEMLTEAVGGGGSWPESRKETFEVACRRMIREHREFPTPMAPNNPSTPDQLLEAAGHLCAVQLIAGKAGYTHHGQSDSSYPQLESYGYEHADRLHLALASKLFKGVSDNRSSNRFTPVHRHIAEFLGARYLAGIIGAKRDPLPAQRVIALLRGGDGAVVSEMRGLSAWLAAHCPDTRADLIERDPIAVGLYGDIRGFSLAEKRALLKSLNRQASRLSSVWTYEVFGPLATPDLEPALREILQETSRDQEHQTFTDFVLCVLEQADPLPGLSEILLGISRDDTRWPRVNRSALRAFVHNCPAREDKTAKLMNLLADIQAGSVSDTNGLLLGILLHELYPDAVAPSEVWDHFSRQQTPEPFGRIRWLQQIIDRSSDQEVAEFLDHLQQRFTELRPVFELHYVGHLPLELLARGLNVHGDQLATARLYDWLGVGQVQYQRNRDAGTHIRSWLEQRPDVQKAVVLEGLGRCADSDEFRFHARHVFGRLHGAGLPPDFGRWCLEQAVAMACTKPRAADHLFGLAFSWIGSEGLSLDDLRESARGNERFRAILDRWLASRSRMEEEDLKHREWERTFTEEQQRKEDEWFARVRSQEEELRDNRADPALLFQLAKLYFDSEFTGAGSKAVWEALRADRHLAALVLKAFRTTVDRQDVPGFEEILSVRAKDRVHYLALPFLAGLAEMDRTGSEDASRWDDRRIRKAIAFYYGYGALLPDGVPRWYQRLLTARPETVAKVQVGYAVSELRSGHEHVAKLWELAHDRAHAQVARHASLPLLRSFPTRCRLAQIGSLDDLLWAAIFHADRTSLRELIEKKRSRDSMNETQRVHWLSAGFAIEPETYQDDLSNFVQGREKRVRHLAQFFCLSQVPSSLFETLGIAGLERFIRLVGCYVGPELMNEQGWGTPAMDASRLVHDLIQRDLAGSPEREASRALDSLIEEPTVSRWHTILSRSRDAQHVLRRDAEFRHPTIEQVCQTLRDGTPANAGDLAALVMDRLAELAAQIRKGNTDDWRQYWEGLRGQSPAPKYENDCRNALLSDLQQRLPRGVDALPEGHYANDGRADIRLFYEGFQIPVEVKKNTHRDLWRAMQGQLTAKYTSAPEADGYGIYLVFWFGKQFTAVASPSGKYPTDAEELKDQLEATLSAGEERRISVCVIDVSKP